MTATASRPRTGKGTRSLRDTAARIVQGLATPVVPDDYLDLFAPLRSGADLRGRIVAITPETRDAATITIRPGRDWQGHAPGQYIRVGVDVDGVRHWRAYSLTSDTSARDGLISITVKAMPDGLVSQHLVHRATPGTIIQIDQASGDFVLPQSVPAKVLFLTGGSGITPVMGRTQPKQMPMTDGSVRDLRTGELTTTTPDDPAVKVQTCISAVAGSCTIETTES